MLAERARKDNMGRIISSINVCDSVGTSIGTIFVSYAYEFGSPELPFYVGTALKLLVATSWVGVHTIEERERKRVQMPAQLAAPLLENA